MKKRKKIIAIIIIVILIIFIISGISLYRKRSDNDESGGVASNFGIETVENDLRLKCENNIGYIKINNLATSELQTTNYLVFEYKSTSNESKTNVPIYVEFINDEGDSIFKTGTVVKNMFAQASDIFQVQITPEILEMIESKSGIQYITVY